jgi:hypothetical protein
MNSNGIYLGRGPRDCMYLIKNKNRTLSYSETKSRIPRYHDQYSPTSIVTTSSSIYQNDNSPGDTTFRTRHYVIGFKAPILARYVQYVMASEPEEAIKLHRTERRNVTGEVNEGLAQLGCAATDGSVVIDTRARLCIPKQQAPDAMTTLDSMYYLDEVSTTDFFMYPFEKNLGIIIPYEIDAESSDGIVLLSSVVESADSTRSFMELITRLSKS